MKKFFCLMLVSASLSLLNMPVFGLDITTLIPNNTVAIGVITKLSFDRFIEILQSTSYSTPSESDLGQVKSLFECLDISQAKPFIACYFCDPKKALESYNSDYAENTVFFFPLKTDISKAIEILEKDSKKKMTLKGDTYSLDNVYIISKDGYAVLCPSKKAYKKYLKTKSAADFLSMSAYKVKIFLRDYAANDAAGMINTDVFKSEIDSLSDNYAGSLEKYNFFKSLKMVVAFWKGDPNRLLKGTVALRLLLNDSAAIRNIFLPNNEILNSEKYFPSGTDTIYTSEAIQPQFVIDVVKKYMSYQTDTQGQETPEAKKSREEFEAMVAFILKNLSGRSAGSMVLDPNSESFGFLKTMFSLGAKTPDALKEFTVLMTKFMPSSKAAENTFSGKTYYQIINDTNYTSGSAYVYQDGSSVVGDLSNKQIQDYITVSATGKGSFDTTDWLKGPDNTMIARLATVIIKSPKMIKQFNSYLSKPLPETELDISKIYMHFGANFNAKFIELMLYAE